MGQDSEYLFKMWEKRKDRFDLASGRLECAPSSEILSLLLPKTLFSPFVSIAR